MRMMQKMGMKVDEVANVSQVIIKTDSKDIVIEEPSVTMVTVQGQAMYQIAGGRISEESPVPQTQTPAGPSTPTCNWSPNKRASQWRSQGMRLYRPVAILQRPSLP